MTKRAICKGYLTYEDLELPVNVYLNIEPFGIHGKLFHEDCNGKIKQERYCEIDEETQPEVFSAMVFDDKLVPINTDIRKALLEKSFTNFAIHSVHSNSELIGLMQDQVVFANRYEMVPQRVPHIEAPFEQIFWTLVAKLRSKRKFLIVETPISGMRRYCILMPSAEGTARLYPLLYQEELRTEEPVGNPSRIYNGMVEDLLDQLDTEMPLLSCKRIIQKIEHWIKLQLKQTNLEVVPVKVKEKVHA